jgi:phytoene dehydrogenase-like protein
VGANFEKFGFSFEAGEGLYAGWGPGDVHEQVFSQLPVPPPEVKRLEPSFVVRLPDQIDVAVTGDEAVFEKDLRAAFPECADAALDFYRTLAPLSKSVKKALAKVPDLQTASQKRQLSAFFPNVGAALQTQKAASTLVSEYLASTSERFRRFLDIQLQTFTQAHTGNCSYLYAALALDASRGSFFSIQGGLSNLAERLGDSIRQSGGRIRLNTPALRLAFDSSGAAIGVDLLSGETVHATKAIISNLTVWDTYGKLVGLSQTPTETRKELNELTAYGSYLVFASLEEQALKRLPAEKVLLLTDWQDGTDFDPAEGQVTLSVATDGQRAPEGKLAVTVHAFTGVDDWFSFHNDETEHEEMDQQYLEVCWQRLHKSLPELGAAIEVIDTSTPRDSYENVRRKLGMVGGVIQKASVRPSALLGHKTFLPNVFRVGDTVLPGAGVSGVTQSALIVADEISALK